MQTVPHVSESYKPGRRAFGHQRRMSPAMKAANEALSLRTREQEGRVWSLRDYGLDPDSAQAKLVRSALAAYPCGA